MKIWIAIYGVYADARPVGVAATEEEAKDLVRAAYWDDWPDRRGEGDPMDHYATGEASGPFTLGQLKLLS